MKKTTLFFILLPWISFPVFAQKIIENPAYEFNNAPHVKITKIVLTDEATRLDFEVKYSPGAGIIIPGSTHIRTSRYGMMLRLTKADGIGINELHKTPSTGVNIYSLYFPPLDQNSETIERKSGVCIHHQSYYFRKSLESAFTRHGR